MADTEKMCADCQQANGMTKSVVATKKITTADEVLYEQFKKQLAYVSVSNENRERLIDMFVAALKLTPEERVEETKVNEENVMCKLLLKGYPAVLGSTVDGILKSLIVKNKNGFTDYEKTNEYVMTLMLEKVKKG